MYSHDGFGLGHLSRTLYLAQSLRALRADADIIILTSSPAAHRVNGLDDFEYVKLPSVTKIGVERYRPHNLHADLKSIIRLRSSLLLAVLQDVQPDLFVVDHRPLGLKAEVLPALEWIRAHAPEVRTVVGLRDIVDDPAIVRQQWAEQRIPDALHRFYDHILVYGDRTVFDPVTEYGIQDVVARKVRYTGYLGRDSTRLSRQHVREALGLQDERLVVVHAGGGGDGEALIGTYLQCVADLPGDIFSLVVTGPLMRRNVRDRFLAAAHSTRHRLVDYENDLLSYVAASDLTVSMGGYNSVVEILSAGARAIVVPRVYPRAEQYIRAQLLQERGLLRLLSPGDLNAAALARHVITALEDSPESRTPVRLDGGPRAAAFLASLLPSLEQERMLVAGIDAEAAD